MDNAGEHNRDLNQIPCAENSSGVLKQIEREFETLGSHFMVILNTKSTRNFDAVAHSLNLNLGAGKKCVYVSVGLPYDYILKEIKKRDIKIENIFFIDCVSAMAGLDLMPCENLAFVETPAELEKINRNIDYHLKRMEEGKKFIVMDSFSTLLIYNTIDSIKEFTCFLINKMRSEKISGIFVVIDKEIPEDFACHLSENCDRVIHI